MRKIIECVPNFSEGRRKDVLDALVAALTGPPTTALLDSSMDSAHNRCVISVAGSPEGVAEGVIAAVGRAVELIDLRSHQGEHPRMGATDVIPFVPIAGVTMEECIDLSMRVGAEIADRYKIPVYLYEQSARIPSRQDLAQVRKGEFEGLREEIRTDPERKPDFGPLEIHPTAGATAIGARPPLIAYNVYLRTDDLNVARAIARAVRFSSGGLRYVKALGFAIKDRNQVQVSMNLTNFDQTPIFRAFELVAREAERYGVSVGSSEIVGLVPQQALNACANHYLRLEGFSKDQILENRLAEVLPQDSGLDGYLASVAYAEPVPGGGSVGAMAGSLAAALGIMVAGLTLGKKKFEAVKVQIQDLHGKLAHAQKHLQELAQEDAESYREVMAALSLPKETEAEKARRSEAIQIATRYATEVPLRTARAALDVMQWLEILIEVGIPSAKSDAATGVQMSSAALKGAQYNVLVNIRGLRDTTFVEKCRTEVNELAARSRRILEHIDDLMTR